MPKIYAIGEEFLASELNEIVKTSGLYTADAGATDTYALTMSPSPGTYAHGDVYRFRANTANNGAATLNINSLGAKSIKKLDSVGAAKVELITGDILAGQMVTVQYDGTDFLIVSSLMPRSLYATGQTSRAHATGTGTQDIAHGLGVVPRLVKITATLSNGSANPLGNISVGTATSTADETCTYLGTNTVQYGQDATHIIYTVDAAGSTEWSATLSALDATNITLNFDVANAGVTIYIQWEAFA